MVAFEMKRPRLSLSMGSLLEPWMKRRDRVAALFVLCLGGSDREPHLLAQDAGQEPADRVRLPAGGFPEFLQGGAARALQQVEALGGLAALAGARCLLIIKRLGRRRAFVGLLRRVGFLARLGPGTPTLCPGCSEPRLL